VLAGSDDLTGKAIGRFQITMLLGKGGMGEVYLAEDCLLKRPVALKRVSAALRSDPQYRELLVKEAERASRLNDEHVAAVHDIVDHQGELFLVMEYVEGQSLRHRMREPVSREEFTAIAEQCAEALIAAHQSGIVHRDIKPENIMITRKGRVKICDFGLARQGAWIEDTAFQHHRTPVVGFCGTPAYMAPESLLNRDPDFRADMFSLGVVLYELLTGIHPFRELNSHIATTDRVLHARPVLADEIRTDVPHALALVIDRMLRKQPSDRFETPNELLAAIRRVPASLPRSRNKSRLTVLLITLIVLTPVLAFYAFRYLPTRTNAPRGPSNLVVLPFRALGGASETRFYSDGLTETITAQLARLTDPASVQVLPATEVRARKVTTAEQARRQFSANLVLAGTFQQVDSVNRLTYSLYDTETMRDVKTGAIEFNASKASALEDRLLSAVSQGLGLSAQPRSNANPTLGEAYQSYLRGRGYLSDASNDEHLQVAVQSLKRAAELDPNYAVAYASLGQAYWSKYKATNEPVWLELAQHACEQSENLNSKTAESKVCLATVKVGTGQYESAVADFEAALEIDPRSDAAYLGLADANEQSGNYAAAERTHLRVIQLRPKYYLGYSRLGQFYLRRARYQDAADQFQKEISLIPQSEQPYTAVGAAYIYLGRYDDAITVLRRSIELRPTFPALSNLGSTLLRLRRYDDAATVFENGTALFGRNYRLAGNLARSYFLSSALHSKATPAYGHAIELALAELDVNPRNSDAHIMLGRYYAMLQERKEALAHLNAALIMRPSEAEYFSIAAVIYNQLGDRTSALRELKKAVSLGWSPAEIQTEIELDNLRYDPEFQKLAAK
jgi:serine/threonine-protein kinase